MSLGKLRMGYIGGKKFYILRKKFYRLICVRKNQKNVGFFEKIGAENLICRNFIFMRWAKKIFICRGVLFITFLYCALSVGQKVGILSHVKNF